MVFHKIDEKSPNSITSALDFFTIPPTNTSVASSTWREYLTLNPVSDIPYRFRIYSTNNYLDLSRVFLLMEMRILKQNAANNWVQLEDINEVSTINFIGSTFIKNIKVSLNGREIYDSNSMYMYKAYLDAELSLPWGAKDSYLSASGYYDDGDSQEDSTTEGFIKRKNRFIQSQTAQFISKLDVDLFNQPNYLISGVEIEVEITPNDSSFCLLEPANTATVYKMEITGLRLYVKSLELMAGLAYDISQKLEKFPARYAIRRSSVKSLFISENRTEYSALLFSEQIPRRIVLGLISNARYVGAKNLSPFHFEHFNTRELSLQVNGKSYPSNAYNLNYTNGQYVRAFHDTMEALGFVNSVESNGLTFEKFKDGWCLYCFNLTNSAEDSNCFDLITEGAVNVNIKFTNPVQRGGVVLISLAEFDGIIYIDKNKNVLSDFTA